MMKWFEYKEIGIGISIDQLSFRYRGSVFNLGIGFGEPDFGLGICIGIGTNY